MQQSHKLLEPMVEYVTNMLEFEYSNLIGWCIFLTNLIENLYIIINLIACGTYHMDSFNGSMAFIIGN